MNGNDNGPTESATPSRHYLRLPAPRKRFSRDGAGDPVTPDDLSATIFHSLGLDPDQELTTATGRPIQLFREGHVVEKLLA
jgi:hypothetical protein